MGVNRSRCCKLWILFGLLSASCLAQVPNVTFDYLSVNDGLPSTAVYSATKDQRGFMWFGTRRCPTRYDGVSFRSFLFPESHIVTGLAADSTNRIWASTDRNGICRIDPTTQRMVSLKSARFAESPTTASFYIDSFGEGWYSDRYGFNRVNLRTGHTVHLSLPQTTYLGTKVYCFLEDNDRTLWVLSSENGLYKLDRRTNGLVCVLGSDCPDPARRFPLFLTKGCLGNDGWLWIGTFQKGLLRLNPRTGQYTLFPTGAVANHITCVEEGTDETGRRLLWVGDDQGLLAFRPEQQRFYRLPSPLTKPFWVNAIYRDRQNGLLWICTAEGLLKYNPQDHLIHTIRFPSQLVPHSTTVNVITADRSDPNGETFWLGLSNTGLLRWHRPTNRFDLIRYPAGTNPETRWIEQSGNGLLWIGVRQWRYNADGVLVYDTRQQRFIPTPASRRAGRLFSVPFVDYGFFDRQHRLWVGNIDEGIQVVDSTSGQVLPYWSDSTMRRLMQNNNLLNDMRGDPTGRVWLAMANGLYCVAPDGRFIRTDNTSKGGNRLQDPATNHLLIMPSGNVWASRWGSVTESRPDGTLETRLTVRQGLYDRENRALAQDAFGGLWIGNFEGLHTYDPRTRKLTRLTVSDGLLQNNTLAALYMHQGRTLLIGQQNAIGVLDVGRLRQSIPAPPLAVSALRINDQERAFDPAKPIRLHSADNNFSLEFTALNYRRLPSNQYAYFLEGLDNHWHRTSFQNQVYYTNLSPGTYTLHLKANDALQHWPAQTLQLTVAVLPAFYETIWFRVAVVALVLGFFYGLYRYRVAQLLRVQRIRNRISADLHDEIGSSLSGISILGTMARQTLPGQHPSLPFVERMMEEIRQISGSLDDIVWSINPHNDQLANLTARMQRYAAELFEARQIAYHIQMPDASYTAELPMEQRRDFYLFFKEAVNNLVKHSGATQASVEIKPDRRGLSLTISDNGIGFEPSVQSERNGLRNLNTRATALRGTLAITSAPGGGTTITLWFPLSS